MGVSFLGPLFMTERPYKTRRPPQPRGMRVANGGGSKAKTAFLLCGLRVEPTDEA